jgi:hypothetical protein
VELKTALNGIFTNNSFAISDLDWAQDRLGGLVLDFDQIQDLSLVGLQADLGKPASNFGKAQDRLGELVSN